MSAGCGGEALPALQCADSEAWRSEGSLEKMHRVKNSVSAAVGWRHRQMRHCAKASAQPRLGVAEGWVGNTSGR